jgi:hypothetical protein
MARYRPKAWVIEAEQWFPGKNVPGVELRESQIEGEGFFPIVRTSVGWLHVAPGDYIVTDLAGNKVPWKPERFEAAFEIIP